MVLDATSGMGWHDQDHASEFDPVSCGVDGKTYWIAGGIPLPHKVMTVRAAHLMTVAGTTRVMWRGCMIFMSMRAKFSSRMK
jgi:hypothetical protein